MLRRIIIAAASLVAVFALAGFAAAAPVRAAACGTPTGPNRVRCTALTVNRPLQRAITAPTGYGPAQLRSAYGLTSIAAIDPATPQTVGIVDAYSDPNLAGDLAAYRSHFGLSACTTSSGCLRIVSETGSTRLPAANPAWGLETSLDAEMVSAICPRCRIVVVDASAPTYADLGTAENQAVRLGARVISNSWGGTDSARDASYDAAYFNHPGVAIIAAAGDAGYAGWAHLPLDLARRHRGGRHNPGRVARIGARLHRDRLERRRLRVQLLRGHAVVAECGRRRGGGLPDAARGCRSRRRREPGDRGRGL